MVGKLSKILFKTYNNIFVLSGVLIILFAGALYLLLGKGAADALVEQMLHRQQISARAGARSLESFFSLFGKSLVGLAARREVISPWATTNDSLNDFISRWKGTPVAGAIILDTSGKVKYNGSRLEVPDTGADLSERDYFVWSKTAKKGEIFVSKPVVSKVGASKGYYIVVVATPAIEDGVFNGLLGASVILEELADQYIDPLKVSEKTRIYLIDDNGVILSAPVEKLVGANYLDYILSLNIPGAQKVVKILKGSLESNNEGKLDIALPDENKNGGLTRYLIAYSPIFVGNEHWTLAVATPASDALEYLVPFYFRDLGLAGLAFIGFLIITIRISKIKGYEEGIETEHKFHSDTPTTES